MTDYFKETGFKPIPNIERYAINKSGSVIDVLSGELLEEKEKGKNKVVYFDETEDCHWAIKDLLYITYVGDIPVKRAVCKKWTDIPLSSTNIRLCVFQAYSRSKAFLEKRAELVANIPHETRMEWLLKTGTFYKKDTVSLSSKALPPVQTSVESLTENIPAITPSELFKKPSKYILFNEGYDTQAQVLAVIREKYERYAQPAYWNQDIILQMLLKSGDLIVNTSVGEFSKFSTAYTPSITRREYNIESNINKRMLNQITDRVNEFFELAGYELLVKYH